MEAMKANIQSPDGKLGILIVGLGAVTTTFVAGVFLIRKGLAAPFGSLTQMQRIRLGKRTENRNPLIKDFIPLADLKNIEFTAWDIFEDNAYEAACKAGVLSEKHLNLVKDELINLKPMKAVFNRDYVKNLDGKHLKTGKTKYDLAQQVREDIRNFKKEKNLSRMVMLWVASTEVYHNPSTVHATIDAFEQGLKSNHEEISPSQIYSYAALMEGVPFANGAPHLGVEIPALVQLANQKNVPIAGKDFKTGQTLMKTIVAPGL